MNSTITVLFYIAAIFHCLASRVIAPYLQAIFNELTADVEAPTSAPPVLSVAAPVKASATKVLTTQRPTLRRRSAAKVA